MSINIVCWSQLSVLSTYACCPAVAKTLKARSLYSIWRFNTIFQFLWQLSWFRVRTSHLLKKAHFNSETNVNVFYSDDYPFKKKTLQPYFNFSTNPQNVSTCSSHVRSWKLVIFTLILTFYLHRNWYKCVLCWRLPFEEKTLQPYFNFSTNPQNVTTCSSHVRSWFLFFLSWYLIMSFHHANPQLPCSRDNLNSTGCS